MEKLEGGEESLPHSMPVSPLDPRPYPAAIMGDFDGSCCCLVEGQLFPVGPLEADGAAVVTCSFVLPGR